MHDIERAIIAGMRLDQMTTFVWKGEVYTAIAPIEGEPHMYACLSFDKQDLPSNIGVLCCSHKGVRFSRLRPSETFKTRYNGVFSCRWISALAFGHQRARGGEIPAMDTVGAVITKLQKMGLFNGQPAYEETLRFEQELRTMGMPDVISRLQGVVYHVFKDPCNPYDDGSICAFAMYLIASYLACSDDSTES